jgi:molybdenum cofactor biosynthesis enzyme MoaA
MIVIRSDKLNMTKINMMVLKTTKQSFVSDVFRKMKNYGINVQVAEFGV